VGAGRYRQVERAPWAGWRRKPSCRQCGSTALGRACRPWRSVSGAHSRCPLLLLLGCASQEPLLGGAIAGTGRGTPGPRTRVPSHTQAAVQTRTAPHLKGLQALEVRRSRTTASQSLAPAASSEMRAPLFAPGSLLMHRLLFRMPPQSLPGYCVTPRWLPWAPSWHFSWPAPALRKPAGTHLVGY